MRAGYGKVEITPPLGVELAGYGYYLKRQAKRVEDPLFVRAAAFDGGEGAQLIVSCDCLGLSRDVASAVEKKLADDCGIAPERVMIVSIHTHTGPALKYHEGCGATDPAYVSGAAEKIAAACQAALEDLAPVEKMEFVSGKLSFPWAYNRACAENPVDDTARAFYIIRPGKAPMAIASYACHAVCQGCVPNISADYPGRICRGLEEKGFLSMYLNGACGDIDPVRVPTEERPKRLEGFADTVLKAVEDGQKQSLPLTASGGSVDGSLQLNLLSREEIHALADRANQRETDPPGGGRVARAWEQEILENYDRWGAEEAFSVRYALLGGVPIAALPFETYTLTGMLIREELNDPRTLVLGCAGEMLGYLPTRDDYDRHSYASLDAFFLYRRMPTQRGEAERLGRDLGKKLRDATEGRNGHD